MEHVIPLIIITSFTVVVVCVAAFATLFLLGEIKRLLVGLCQ